MIVGVHGSAGSEGPNQSVYAQARSCLEPHRMRYSTSGGWIARNTHRGRRRLALHHIVSWGLSSLCSSTHARKRRRLGSHPVKRRFKPICPEQSGRSTYVSLCNVAKEVTHRPGSTWGVEIAQTESACASVCKNCESKRVDGSLQVFWQLGTDHITAASFSASLLFRSARQSHFLRIPFHAYTR